MCVCMSISVVEWGSVNFHFLTFFYHYDGEKECGGYSFRFPLCWETCMIQCL